MGVSTSIAWTDHTFNIAWGCMKISPGCANCYADAFSRRTGHHVWGPPATTPRRLFKDGHWREPLAWHAAAEREGPIVLPDGSTRPHLVFSSSMCDVFEDHPSIDAERARLWPLIKATPALHWQLLTKRADRIAEQLPADWGPGYPNVWLGVSIEADAYTARANMLRRIPAAVRFVSYEPAIGPLPSLNLEGIDWLIAGGESGGGRRPFDPAWGWAVLEQCQRAGAAFFFKQDGGQYPGQRPELLGGVLRQAFPVPRRLGV